MNLVADELAEGLLIFGCHAGRLLSANPVTVKLCGDRPDFRA
jgi:hypothetical protein